jgi:hypothetical protein
MQLHKFEFFMELKDGEVLLNNPVIKSVLKIIVPSSQVVMFDSSQVSELTFIKEEVKNA